MSLFSFCFKRTAVAVIFRIKHDIPNLTVDFDAASNVIDELLLKCGDKLTINVLLMRRTVSARDVHSGLLCFPGGKMDAEDVDFRACAIRETKEEIGIDLVATKKCVYLGEADFFEIARPKHLISPQIFLFFDNEDELTSGSLSKDEVAELILVPAEDILNDNLQVMRMKVRSPIAFPCLKVGEKDELWGVSHRILYLILNRAKLSNCDVAFRGDSLKYKIICNSLRFTTGLVLKPIRMMWLFIFFGLVLLFIYFI